MYKSIARVKAPGLLVATWVCRVSGSALRGAAGSVKNRYASKWLQRNGIDSTTASVPAGPSRNGT